MRNLAIAAATFAFVAMGGQTSPAFAQAGHQHEAEAPAQPPAPPAMKGQKMMEAPDARVATLAELVQQMNTSTGDAKLDSMAALLTRLVEGSKTPEPASPSATPERKCGSMKKPDGAAK